MPKRNEKSDYFKEKTSPYFAGTSKNLPKIKIKRLKCTRQHFKTWVPPKSPYNLIQESLYNNPWQLLVATIFLNKTQGKTAIPILKEFFEIYPNPESVLKAEEQDIANFLKPIGLNNRRAKSIKRFTSEFLCKKWKYPIELHGIGKYGNDSYKIFVLGEWRSTKPNDKMLNKYHEWLLHENEKKIK